MSDRVLLKVYYFGQILLQTSEGVTFVCENLLDIVIPFTISFEELKGVICEKIHSERARRVACILYRYPVQVFGGFVQFQTKYVTDEASMQEMFSMYIENRSQLAFIELYVEFEQSEADRNILREDYNSDSEEEFESNYEVVGPDGDEDQGDGPMVPDVSDVANALANKVPFEEPSFMRVLDLEAMHVPEFPDYTSADGKFAVGMEFISREAVIKAIKEYTIRRSVDYRDIRGRCGSMKFATNNEVFEVREMPSGLEFAVDLRGHRCDCVRRVYRARFRPLGNPTTWPAYNGPRFIPNPFLRRVTKGRPRMTRFLNEMDTRMLRRPRRCTLCGAEGHSRSRCRRSGGANAGGGTQ
ncbi:hypothetical protein Ahy_B08g094257 [Arachis hypogaea]|uniref:CCHC-type domain-containing protein n=1 Tax=Arachis hypogaea TaxID=3818 RepID=A0A444Y8C5_ARAHY|nr:hypothetical protein Ahy_B08g094257 [Arachis hypogaea]